MTKVAISVWNGRVSPVMDTAQKLLIATIDESREISRSINEIPRLHLIPLARHIAEYGVDVLICGAISRHLAVLLSRSGIRICPWISGNIDEIIRAFVSGELQNPCFKLPGFAPGSGCRRRWRGHGRRGRNRGNMYFEEEV